MNAQILPKHSFQEIYERMLFSTSTRTQRELASLLEIGQSAISDAKKRDNIPAQWLLTLNRKCGINPLWLEKGEEPIYNQPEKAPTGALAKVWLDRGKSNPAEVREEPLPLLGQRQMSRGQCITVYNPVLDYRDEAFPFFEFLEVVALPAPLLEEGTMVFRIHTSEVEPYVTSGAYIVVKLGKQLENTPGLYAFLQARRGLVLAWCEPSGKGWKIEFAGIRKEISHDDLLLGLYGKVIWTLQPR